MITIYDYSLSQFTSSVTSNLIVDLYNDQSVEFS